MQTTENARLVATEQYRGYVLFVLEVSPTGYVTPEKLAQDRFTANAKRMDTLEPDYDEHWRPRDLATGMCRTADEAMQAIRNRVDEELEELEELDDPDDPAGAAEDNLTKREAHA